MVVVPKRDFELHCWPEKKRVYIYIYYICQHFKVFQDKWWISSPPHRLDIICQQSATAKWHPAGQTWRRGITAEVHRTKTSKGPCWKTGGLWPQSSNSCPGKQRMDVHDNCWSNRIQQADDGWYTAFLVVLHFCLIVWNATTVFSRILYPQSLMPSWR